MLSAARAKAGCRAPQCRRTRSDIFLCDLGSNKTSLQWAGNQSTPTRIHSAELRSRLALQMRSRRSSQSSRVEGQDLNGRRVTRQGRADRWDRDRGRVNLYRGGQRRRRYRQGLAPSEPEARELRATRRLRHSADRSTGSPRLAHHRRRRTGSIRHAPGTCRADCSERVRRLRVQRDLVDGRRPQVHVTARSARAI